MQFQYASCGNFTTETNIVSQLEYITIHLIMMLDPNVCTVSKEVITELNANPCV